MTEPSPERWREIDLLMDRVLDASASERAAILEEAGRQDPDLRAQVERLLAASESAGSMFDEPPLLVARDVLQTTLDEARDQFANGDMVGAYRIISLLGRGGMGAVYQAERADGAFEKTVAIKIVKRGMDTDEIIRRFRHERRILARLEHPNIAGLIDGGVTEDGLPYFVMELAAGDTIDAWCDRHTLLLRERLQLFERVCEAVQYAHGNLIVHRDIKPGNILVADDGVKLLDFGIAKLLGAEEHTLPATQAHEARLTPQYAAPEQIRGHATTTATDVYSLGALLYELLCGRPPYRLDGRTMLEIEQIICQVDPPPPSVGMMRTKPGDTPPDEIAHRRGIGRASTLQQQLRGDLDAICLKALRKAPDERYVAASALAEDIRRYLDGRAVHAHPPSRSYRVRKFVRRNRTSVALGTIATLALVGGSVTVGVLGRRAAFERDLRQAEAERATAARDFMINTLSSFDPEASPGQLQFSAHDLVERGRDNLDELDVQPLLKASVMNTLGQVAFNLGERAIADSLFRAALDILEANGGGADLATSKYGIGQVLERDRRYGDAVQWYREALALRRRLGTSEAIAEGQRALAFALYRSGGDSALSEAERLFTALLAWPDSMREVRANAFEGLADVVLERGEFERADSLYNAALSTRLEYQSASHPDVARLRWGLVYVAMSRGRPELAEQMSRDIIETLEDTYGTAHDDIALGYVFLGSALSRQRKYEEAAAAYLHAARISDSVNVPGHPATADAWRRYGEVLLLQDNNSAAQQAFREARRIQSVGFLAGADTAEAGDAVAAVDTLLAHTLLDEGRTAEAVAVLRDASRLASDARLIAAVTARLASLGVASIPPDSSRSHQ